MKTIAVIDRNDGFYKGVAACNAAYNIVYLNFTWRLLIAALDSMCLTKEILNRVSTVDTKGGDGRE